MKDHDDVIPRKNMEFMLYPIFTVFVGLSGKGLLLYMVLV